MASSLDGVAELTKQLKELGKLEDGKAIRAAVRAGGNVIVRQAKANVPKGRNAHKTYKGRIVAPGFASRNIRMITVLSSDKQKATAVVGVRKEAFYALQFIERGTTQLPAHPWLGPASRDTQSQQEEAIANSLKKTIAKAASAK